MSLLEAAAEKRNAAIIACENFESWNSLTDSKNIATSTKMNSSNSDALFLLDPVYMSISLEKKNAASTRSIENNDAEIPSLAILWMLVFPNVRNPKIEIMVAVMGKVGTFTYIFLNQARYFATFDFEYKPSLSSVSFDLISEDT